MEEIITKITFENLAVFCTIVAFFYAIIVLRNDYKSRQKQNEISESNLKFEKFKSIHSLQKHLLFTIEELAKLPVRNNIDYIALRITSEATVIFDTHQPLINEHNLPKDNQMYYTLYDALKMQKNEVAVLFPKSLSKYENFLSTESEIFKELHVENANQNLEKLINLEKTAQERYKKFCNSCINEMKYQ